MLYMCPPPQKNCTVFPINSFSELLTPQMAAFKEKAFKMIIKVEWGHKSNRPSTNRISVLNEKEMPKTFPFFHHTKARNRKS